MTVRAGGSERGSIFLVGFMACGKTTTGPLLAERLGLPFIDLDRLIEEREGRTIAEIIAGLGEEGFRQIETQWLREALAGDPVVMAPGGGAILRPVNREVMASHGLTVWLDAPFELCWERIRGDRVVRPLAADEPAARARFEQRLPIYREADLRVGVTAGMAPAAIVEQVIGQIIGRMGRGGGAAGGSILVRGANWIGDAVMSTPALQRLRDSFPDSRISLLATPLTCELFAESPLVDEVIPYRRREEGRRAFLTALGVLRRGDFDLALLFQNAFEAALLAWAARIPRRIGYAVQGRGPLLTTGLRREARDGQRHQIEDYIDIVAAGERVMGRVSPGNAERHLPRLVAGERDRDLAERLLERAAGEAGGMGGERLVALNAGATNSRAKCWPAESYAALAERFAAEGGWRVLLVGGPGEVATAAAVASLARPGSVINLAGRTTLPELLGIFERCALIVSNDTGPAHIAAALGRPVLTIFGPTNEIETAPTGIRAGLIRADGIPCARCMHRDCPIDHRCMTAISVEQVYHRATSLLAEQRS